MTSDRGSPSGLERGLAWWKSDWATVTVGAAIVATALDAALLHRRRSYFTGGFLSTDHITTAVEAAGFFVGSLAADAGVIALIVAVVLWWLARAGWSRLTAWIVAAACALAPLVIADFVQYRLLAFLGDAFDAGLMFELAGRSPAEFLAVSSEHLAGIGLAMAVVAALLTALIVAVRRRSRASGLAPRRQSFRRAFVPALAAFVVALITTTTLRASSDVLDNGLRRKPSGQWLGTIVSAISDVDRDGFGLLGRPSDPAPFDASVFPWAIEIPGNGLDENGLAGDLPAGDLYREPDAEAIWSSRQSVVLIVLESFRADAVGATMDGRPVTPVLDDLAMRGVSSAHAFSHNGYTVQSRRHIFTGSVADIRLGTLIDDFNANGYETAYFSGQDESFGGVGGQVGFGRASVRYDARDDVERRYSTFSTAGSLAVPFNVVTERVGEFLAKRQQSDRPLFLHVNFHDTHFPYHHAAMQARLPGPVLEQFEIRPERASDLRAMYLNSAANVDRAIGDVLSRLRAASQGDPAVIVLSDHGESLFDEGFLGHGYALNDAQTRIPLIVANLPLVIAEPFGQADLRDALRRALDAPRGGSPTLRQDRDRPVFQYLGLLERPAQIAFTRLDGQTVYDFRTRRVQFGGGAWRRVEDLDTTERAQFLALANRWERMVIARSR